MKEDPGNKITVLKQNDPYLPEYLDFKKLRKEGLEHIGLLAGKIWTDHNLHDPGITTLEVLVYALMDLGYRTNLPFKDIIAPAGSPAQDDNFLTPLEILTINPVTITDYRKLLLEIDGVRNAWLEPAEQQIPLTLNQSTNSLFCRPPVVPEPSTDLHHALAVSVPDSDDDCLITDQRDIHYLQINLNGLYNVYIEKDEEINSDEEQQALIRRIKASFSAHRNLCEDIKHICILDPVDIGVCAEIDIEQGYDPDKIYAQIIRALRYYIQPDVKYYTLQQLLDKGRTIDTIFAGRPYGLKSFGFIDTEELEALGRNTELHTSDLYSVILAIEGVRRVRKLHFKGGAPLPSTGFCTDADGRAGSWYQGISIQDKQAAVFSLELTCVDLFDTSGFIAVNTQKALRTISFIKKYRLPQSELDCRIPYGSFHEDLEDYISIQNDFPVVYGVGEDGLPESASLKRQAQALQFKGYLMFFDQMLANYSSQLANLRTLFSLTPESQRSSSDRKTYFTQIASAIPGAAELLRFYEEDEMGLAGTRLAIPVRKDCKWEKALDKLKTDSRARLKIAEYCEDNSSDISILTFSSAPIRNIYVNQLIDSFFNDASVPEIYYDKSGYFFVLDPNIPDDIILVGVKRYDTYGEALQEAKNVGFLSALENSYNLISDLTHPSGNDFHYFNISYNPLSYIELIQGITEEKQEYLKRRKLFSDHLLARFGEAFTDYTLLRMRTGGADVEILEKEVEDQSNMLGQIDEVSRNRAKAFDYRQDAWNSDNVSGFEKRISRLAGIENSDRRNLCNFEVTPCFKLHIKDWTGKSLFRGKRSFENKAELFHAASRLLEDIRTPENYPRLAKNLNGFKVDLIRSIFSLTASVENIHVSRRLYYHQLVDGNGKVITPLEKKMLRFEKTARNSEAEFIQKVNKGAIELASDKNFRLIPTDRDHQYLNTGALNWGIDEIQRYRWEKKETSSNKRIRSTERYESKTSAWEHLIREPECQNYITRHPGAMRWTLRIRNTIKMHCLLFQPDRGKATATWRRAKVLGGNAQYYTTRTENDTVILQLQNEKGKSIAETNPISRDDLNIAALVEDCVRIFSNRGTRPRYEKADEKFGFKIPDKKGSPILVSYNNYDSEQLALQSLENAFLKGNLRKNYMLSGDEGNPEYNFLLRDASDAFMAHGPSEFETAAERDEALTKGITLIKNNKSPLSIRPEPKRYIWKLRDLEDDALKCDRECSSKEKAEIDFNESILAYAKDTPKSLVTSYYHFQVASKPSEYEYIYGIRNEHKDFVPLFKSNERFRSEDEAKEAYAVFAKNLPSLVFKKSAKKENRYDFALFEGNKKIAEAIQYREGSKRAPYETAKSVMTYFQNIYTRKGTPRERFIEEALAANRDGLYEWRFLKKNAPIAHSPYRCYNKELASELKRLICGVVPPIPLKECPPKVKVVCPPKDKPRFHYQVCFEDNSKNEFILYSYEGYSSKEEAESAWEQEWFRLIDLARDLSNYGPGGKISLKEIYREPDSNACKDDSFLAVVPKEVAAKFSTSDKMIEYYHLLANLYPIYKLPKIYDGTSPNHWKYDESCSEKFIYRVTVPGDKLKDHKCELNTLLPYLGSLLWESTACFKDIDSVIFAYHNFCNLVCIPTNCRILCDDGKFYVGLLEVMVESLCTYSSKNEAWDVDFPKKQDACNECIPGGVREFIYAGEEDRNYIPYCEDSYWSFKVVAPSYYIVDHTCQYDNEKVRDGQMKHWLQALKKVDWSKYITKETFLNVESQPHLSFLTHFVHLPEQPPRSQDEFCEFVQAVRECLPECIDWEREVAIVREVRLCVLGKLKHLNFLNAKIILNSFDLKSLIDLSDYFPVHKTDTGYCFRLYWPKNDEEISPGGLLPCGCEENEKKNPEECDHAYIFKSSSCYPCCEEAMDAFMEFCRLVEKDGLVPLCTEKSPVGPYSFQLVDTSKVIGYHPQQYNCVQDVYDAIENTKNCLDNTGMHLLEHILLRPQPKDCTDISRCDDEGLRDDLEFECCTLPVCPDYCCPIEWQPDMDKDDPCADSILNRIYYLPGSDPYSFWATLTLPSWDKRFRSRASREAFEKFLYKEVPALVGLNILWLSPKDMCEFEDAYRYWLEWKQDPCAELHCSDGELSPQCRLVELLKRFRSEDPCPTVPGASGDCDCKPDDLPNDDPCCLPPETEGTLFWGYCPPPEIPGVILSEAHLMVAPETSPVSPELKPKTKRKKSKKTARGKKVSSKAEKEKITALVRARKPGYLANIEKLADNTMKETKSYERTKFFISNLPTLKGFTELVGFFARYSLQKDNNLKGFLGLIENATWHLLDHLVLDRKTPLSTASMSGLEEQIKKLKSKGLSLKNTAKEWKVEPIEELTHKGVLKQIRSILK